MCLQTLRSESLHRKNERVSELSEKSGTSVDNVVGIDIILADMHARTREIWAGDTGRCGFGVR